MLAILNMGPTEWIIVLVVALLLFGRRLPEVMRNLGKGIVEFKRGVRGIEDQIDEESMRHTPPPAPPPPPAVSPPPTVVDATHTQTPQASEPKET